MNIEYYENKIKDLEFRQHFLLKLIKYTFSSGIDKSQCFRIKKGETWDFRGCQDANTCTDFQEYENMISKPLYNYKNYSNLPSKGVLYYLEDDNIVHDGYLKRIYGYLDHENKTLISIDIDYDKEKKIHKFI